MMKVTKTTFNEIAANRREKNMAQKPWLQKQLKSGNWGKPFVLEYSKGDPIEYMERLNPGCKYRIAQ